MPTKREHTINSSAAEEAESLWRQADPQATMADEDVVEIRCASDARLVTTRTTIQRVPSCLLSNSDLTQTVDSETVALLLAALRHPEMSLLVPEGFRDWERLSTEAQKLGLRKLVEAAMPTTICVACHGGLSTGRLNPEVTFRKIFRIVVSGRVSACRSVFGDNLNECRDSGGCDFHEEGRYTSRFFLKHNSLERAFDTLASRGFRLINSNTFAPAVAAKHAGDDTTFIHHSQFVFQRFPQKLPSPVDQLV